MPSPVPSSFTANYKVPIRAGKVINPFMALDAANRNYAELHSEMVELIGKLVGEIPEAPRTEIQPGHGLLQLTTAVAEAMDSRTKHIQAMMTQLSEFIK